MPVAADAFAVQDRRQRQPKNFEVEQEALVVNIPDIKFKFLLPCQGIPSIDLCPAGDARANVMPSGLPRIVKRQILHQQWSWTNKTHVPPQHVPEFWQFIQACGSHETPERGQSVCIRQRHALCSRCIRHCTKLQHLKRCCSKPRPDLSKQDRCSQFYTCHNSDDSKWKAQYHQGKKRKKNIKHPFHCNLRPLEIAVTNSAEGRSSINTT
jgi:hypothetical protein